MAQPFLKACHHGLVIGRFHINHPVRVQPGLGQSGGEQVRFGQAPQHLARAARQNASGEQCGAARIQHALPAAGHLVQRPAQQAAFRQAGIQRRHPKRQHAARRLAVGLNGGDARTQRLQCGGGPRV